MENILSDAMRIIDCGDVEKGVSMLELCARSGRPEVFALVGRIFEDDGAHKDCERAIAYYEEGGSIYVYAQAGAFIFDRGLREIKQDQGGTIFLYCGTEWGNRGFIGAWNDLHD